MKPRLIDFRSDTVTKPTERMREAMYRAEVGDDGRAEDPTVNELERLAALRMNKEAALLVPSGTMGNLIALMTHCRRGQEVILDANAHILWYEVGGVSSIAGLMTRTIPSVRGAPNPDDVEAAIRPNIRHFPKTSLICLENTHNLAGGTVLSNEQVSSVCEVARRHDLPVHMDGARIFNACVALGVEPKELTKDVNSVMFCLSKGLSAPIGSVLCGDEKFIDRARTNRLLLGGGMRQAGVIAAGGIVALEDMVDRLAEDHENARHLALGLAGLTHLHVDLTSVQTNIVMVEVEHLGPGASAVASRLKERGIGCLTEGKNKLRFVTHRHITFADVEHTVDVMADLVKSYNLNSA